MNKNNIKIKYNKEADALIWELSPKTKIDYATEMGNIITHFSKDNIPVLIEILEASKFIRQNEEKLGIKFKHSRDFALAA